MAIPEGCPPEPVWRITKVMAKDVVRRRGGEEHLTQAVMIANCVVAQPRQSLTESLLFSEGN